MNGAQIRPRVKECADIIIEDRPPCLAYADKTVQLCSQQGTQCIAAQGTSSLDQLLTKIGELTNAHPNLSIRLLWLPRSIPFIGFRRAKQLALEAICIAPAEAAKEPCTIKNQKQKTREEAITTWATWWHQAPHTSLVYRTALTKPLDGQAHPVFHIGQNPAKFSWKTFCTLYQIITGHAFIGSYTQRFHLQHTPEQIACSCGEPV